MPWNDVERDIIEKASKDADFRKQLVADPNGAIEQHTGKKLPAGTRMHVHEEKAGHYHLVLPASPGPDSAASDAALETAVGTISTCSGQTTCNRCPPSSHGPNQPDRLAC